MATNPATIDDVARKAGVSIATVSRALSKPEMVSAGTRERVQAAVEELGYTANVMARNLRLRRTRVALVLVPNIGNQFFSAILAGIESVASERGYSVLIGDTESNPAHEREFAAYVRSHQADGLIVLNGSIPPLAREKDSPNAPGLPPLVVACERIPGSDLPTVYFDNVSGAREATAYLIEMGHRRIAHVTGPPTNILTQDRLEGYREALRDAGLRPQKQLMIEGDFSIDSGRRAVHELAKLKSFPTAIFCANDEMAMGVISSLKDMGLKVPEDVSVVGFDDIQFADAIDPPLTTVHQPRDDIGRAAMTMMLDVLDGKPLERTKLVVKGPFKIRSSAAPPTN